MNKLLQALVCAIILVAQTAQAQALKELLQAVEEGDLKRTVFYLDRGMDPNTTDATGNTILMIACRRGHTDLASTLIARKASVSRQTPAGDTALLMASLGGHLDVVQLLVKAGAPVQTPSGWQPIHYAAFNGATDVMGFLLDEGADKNALAPENQYTPLMLAVRNGHEEAAKLLISRGADLNSHSFSGETALAIAERLELASLVELLKQAGAAK